MAPQHVASLAASMSALVKPRCVEQVEAGGVELRLDNAESVVQEVGAERPLVEGES
jgi:hypothetical protein